MGEVDKMDRADKKSAAFFMFLLAMSSTASILPASSFSPLYL